MTNETVCSAFWVHTNIRGGNRIFPCCRYKTPLQSFDGNVDAVLHSDQYQQLRTDSQAGVSNPNCEKCYHEEKLGKHSLRQWFNKTYSKEHIELKYFEIGFDNICNLTCDGCWEEWSSSWWVKLNPQGIPKQGILNTSEFVDIPDTLERIVFLGGEPLMTNRHRKFLESIKDLSKLDVEYFTNGMFELTKQDYQLLDQCRSIKFTVSIDGVGQLNETVRSGSVWPIVEAFAKSLKYNKVIHTTVHKNNWHGLRDLKNWIDANNFIWTTNVLTYPQHLDIINLSLEEKTQLIAVLNSYDIPNRDYIESHLNS